MSIIAKARVSSAKPDATGIAQEWLGKLEAAFSRKDSAAAVKLFATDGSWRDLVALSWHIRSYNSPAEIKEGFESQLANTEPKSFRTVSRRSPSIENRAGRSFIQAQYDFETKSGRGEGLVRLIDVGGGEYRALTLSTALKEIKGHEPRIGIRRPPAENHGARFGRKPWQEQRNEAQRYEDHDPAVLIIGGAQAGLGTAARLSAVGVDTLVIEKTPRIGDVWRNRYDSLVLHTTANTNNLPLVPFPDSWPEYIPKDMLANWLEHYAGIMNLNIWTGTELTSSNYDATAKRWNVEVRRADGTIKALKPRHIVVATGLSGKILEPDMPGLDEFGGDVLHATKFKNGAVYRGKKAIVFGVGATGQDNAQDLHAYGADVTIVQRGPMIVVDLDTNLAAAGIFSSGLPLDDIDLTLVSDPYSFMIKASQYRTKEIKEIDRELIEGLTKVGFKTHYGSDDSGFVVQYFRKGGGYYLNVGASDLIASGDIKLLSYYDIVKFTKSGIELKDGSQRAFDLAVFATGFEDVTAVVTRMFGEDVAKRVGKVSDYDEGGELNSLYRRTGQPGLWFIAGGLPHTRQYSKYLALQIQACELGLISAAVSDPVKG